MLLAETRIDGLAAQLKSMIDVVRATEIKSTDGKWTVAEGADFNYQLAKKAGSVVHNPFLIEALMNSSITAMRDTYGLPVPAGLNLENILGK